MKIELPFGKEKKELNIPDANLLQVLTPNETAPGLSGIILLILPV